MHRVGNGGCRGCETVSREVLLQVEIPEKWTQGPPLFCHNNWCAIKIAHQSRPENNKLLTYSMFKHSISLENYILQNQNSLKERRHFTKLRISAHSLAVETGRYSKPKIPVESRLCQHCNQGVIENEYHMVMECAVYSLERKELFDQLSDFCNVPFQLTTNTKHLLYSCHMPMVTLK